MPATFPVVARTRLFGVAHGIMAFAPERPVNPFDRLLVAAANRFYNRTPLDGDVPPPGRRVPRPPRRRVRGPLI